MDPRNCGYCLPCALGDYENCVSTLRGYRASPEEAADTTIATLQSENAAKDERIKRLEDIARRAKKELEKYVGIGPDAIGNILMPDHAEEVVADINEVLKK